MRTLNLNKLMRPGSVGILSVQGPDGTFREMKSKRKAL